MTHAPRQSRPPLQRGVATLPFVLMASIGLVATAALVVAGTQATQRLQHAEHTATQAEMTAWTGVTLLSRTVAQLPPDAVLTAGGQVAFQGAQPGLSARYVGLQDSFLIFEVTGASAGARSILRVALRPPVKANSGHATINMPQGTTLHGRTVLGGDIRYLGTDTYNLHVLDGPLSLSGSVSGLSQVCATGDIAVGSAITVDEVCTNGNVTFQGSTTVTMVKARGNVTLTGGATSTLGTIHSNGAVSLTGGSASAGTILATGHVSVTGGSAQADQVRTEGNIDWTSTATATTLQANGTVTYTPTAGSANTDIEAQGNVTLSTARNVRTQGNTRLTGYAGQGITGRLDGQGLLSGNNWGAAPGVVVASGTVGSITSPYPSTVSVSVSPGHTVSIPAVSVPTVPLFARPNVVVDAYALKAAANFAFVGVDARGNPKVEIAGLNGVTDGVYYITRKSTSEANYLCATADQATCAAPLAKVCEGTWSGGNCFSRSGGTWNITGTTMLPSVLWFDGSLNVGSGTWVNAFIATGDISVSGSVKVYAPNYIGSDYACQGLAHTPSGLPAWSAHGLNSSNRATQLCAGTPPVLLAAAAGNIGLLAGGYDTTAGTYVGGNVTLGASNEIFGAILAGQHLNTGGSTVIAGATYAAGQGGSTAQPSNQMSGSTTINPNGGSSAFNPGVVPCMSHCAPTGAGHNVVWAAPA